MLLPQTVIAERGWIAAQDKTWWLTPREQAAYDGWRSAARQADWLAGRLAAKRLLLEELGIAPQSWFVGRDGPAPCLGGLDLPHLRLSLSHCGGVGAAAVSDSRTEGSAGIDIQRVRPVHPGFCARVFTARERTQIAAQFGAEDSAEGMLLLWSLKEAAIKARRLPWGRALQAVEVRLTAPGASEIVLPGEPPMAAQYRRHGDCWLARAVKPPRPNSGEQPPHPNSGEPE